MCIRDREKELKNPHILLKKLILQQQKMERKISITWRLDCSVGLENCIVQEFFSCEYTVPDHTLSQGSRKLQLLFAPQAGREETSLQSTDILTGENIPVLFEIKTKQLVLLKQIPPLLFIKFHDYSKVIDCLLYTSPSPRDLSTSRMPSSA
eukprot:TRINITY_DN22752_c0_g1_i1.p1 TRINITY_DN22752_c0_g1~~TRINITY_DN22752_c0_g1_i1.p1  ORF type:complete len:159 (-),score=28.64 TRINITY_DN22752_c0_g1_i1:57-509(-)